MPFITRFPARALTLGLLVAGLALPWSARPAAATDARGAAIAHLRAAIAEEAALPLQNGSESLLMVHDTPARGMLVMYHGFSAGTWQFKPLADACYAAGFDVYVPRMPGHGFKDARGIEDPSHLPTGQNWQAYERFGDTTYQAAQALGEPVSTLGLSVGGVVALWVAEHHPVEHVVAYAPFLKPIIGNLIFDSFMLGDTLSGEQSSRALNGWGFSWGEETRLQTLAGKRPGHSFFSVGNLFANAEFGRDTLREADRIQAPVQFFTTGADDAAQIRDIQIAYERSGGAVTDGWYHYPKAEGIPHPMVHPLEDKGHGQTPALYRMTLGFLETGTRFNRLDP